MEQEQTALENEEQTALENGDLEKATSLKQEIRKHARKDKKQSLLHELEEIDRDGYKWDGFKKPGKHSNQNIYSFCRRCCEIYRRNTMGTTAE